MSAQTAKREVTIGSDPEVAIYAAATKTIIPVCGLFGGDKGAPIIVNEHGGWLEDGVALELNPTPSTDPRAHAASITNLLAEADKVLTIKGMVTKRAISYATFAQAALEKHPKAMEFGCAVDYSAYLPGIAREGTMQKAAAELGDPNIRFYGGHIHLGVSNWPDDLPKFVAVRLLEALFGVGFMRTHYPQTNIRDKYYGVPGLYRETKYGIEYRTPGNRWITENNAATLTRAHAVGQIFGNFEANSGELVRIYNTLDWDKFHEALERREWDLINQTLNTVTQTDKETGSTYFKFVGDKGDMYLPPMGLMVGDEQRWNDYLGKGPIKSTVRLANYAGLQFQEVAGDIPARDRAEPGYAEPMPPPAEDANDLPAEEVARPAEGQPLGRMLERPAVRAPLPGPAREAFILLDDAWWEVVVGGFRSAVQWFDNAVRVGAGRPGARAVPDDRDAFIAAAVAGANSVYHRGSRTIRESLQERGTWNRNHMPTLLTVTWARAANRGEDMVHIPMVTHLLPPGRTLPPRAGA